MWNEAHVMLLHAEPRAEISFSTLSSAKGASGQRLMAAAHALTRISAKATASQSVLLTTLTHHLISPAQAYAQPSKQSLTSQTAV